MAAAHHSRPLLPLSPSLYKLTAITYLHSISNLRITVSMGREGQVVAILRGLKVRVPVLDRFLDANGIDKTYGDAPFYDKDPDEQTRFLRSKTGSQDTRTRIFVPYRIDFNHSDFAYVAYAWELTFAQKEILLNTQLPEQLPTGWERLKDEIMSFTTTADSEGWQAAGHGSIGLFIIVSDNRYVVPPSIEQRNRVSVPRPLILWPLATHITDPSVEQRPAHCDSCSATFEGFIDRQKHRRSVHGADEGNMPLPNE